MHWSRAAAGAAALLLLGGCAHTSDQQTAATRPATETSGRAALGPTAIAPSVTVAAGDRAACTELLARLQRVTAAIQASSELLTSSVDPRQLSRQIAVEQQQLQRSAQLIGQGPVPPPLTAARQDLVTALQGFSADFARAQAPAVREDFPAAVKAMTDRPVVDRIVAAATTIDNACR